MITVQTGVNRLKEMGAKVTSQRVAILKFLEEYVGHASAEVIYSALKHEHPTISIATIYNTVQLFHDAGLIKLLTIDNERVYFEHNIETPHGHLLCSKCAKLIDVPLPENFLAAAESAAGIPIDRVDIFYYGVCADCAKSS